MKRLALVLTLLLIVAALWASLRHKSSLGPANPIAQYLLPGFRRFTIAGRIEERLAAGSYVYFRVGDPVGASHWIVTLGDSAPCGDNVEATVYARAESFYSKRLGRRFSPLFFGVLRSNTTSLSPRSRQQCVLSVPGVTVQAAVPSTTSTHLGKKEVP